MATGANPLIVMQLSEELWKEAWKNHLNVVMTGHMAGDNPGLNLLLDEVKKGEDLGVFACLGFRKVTRAH